MSIKVKHRDGIFMIWNADDVLRLRREYRIVGNLVGALPEFPRQPDECGLPLVLMPEEVRLLHKISAITIVNDYDREDARSIQSSEQYKSYYAQQKAMQYEEINRRFKESRKAEIEANLDKIVQGKLKKGKTNFSASHSSSSSPTPEAIAQFRAQVHAELLDSIRDLPKDNLDLSFTRFHISNTFPSVPEREFMLVAPRPRSLNELKFAVFEHFWRKGYFLTDGLKFGVHFLAYDHDPIGFHSKFLVMCYADANALRRFEDSLLQAYGRLSKNVRKNVIVAHFVDSSERNENDQIVEAPPNIAYKRIQWNTIGLA